ncbi:hypothetical protein QJS66_04500 [Kocuria rhizophila]|nr:hypothetical protein QJS66_04500 [Kocuria rhizophila]
MNLSDNTDKNENSVSYGARRLHGGPRRALRAHHGGAAAVLRRPARLVCGAGRVGLAWTAPPGLPS